MEINENMIMDSDLDHVYKNISDKIPFIDSERILLLEFKLQQKIYFVFSIIGILIFIFVLLL
jgi:hypothetical protein